MIPEVSKLSEELQIMTKSHPEGRNFPPLCRKLVRSLPGNSRCVDCNSPNPDWASVSFGCLICLNCSGRHRSMGVQKSKVRSIEMDHWTHDQVLAMLEGGNRQLLDFFDRHQMDKMPTKRYHTKAAKFYREHLSKHVRKLTGHGPYQGREASRQLYHTNNNNDLSTPASGATNNTRAATVECI